MYFSDFFSELKWCPQKPVCTIGVPFPALISKHCRFIWVLIPLPVQSFASSSAPVLIGLQVSLVRSLSVSKRRSIFLMRFCLLTAFSRRSNRLSLPQATGKLYQTHREEIAFILEGACLHELWLTAMFALVAWPRFRYENEQKWFHSHFPSDWSRTKHYDRWRSGQSAEGWEASIYFPFLENKDACWDNLQPDGRVDQTSHFQLVGLRVPSYGWWSDNAKWLDSPS